MLNNKKTHVAFVLDESGSMWNIRNKTVEVYNMLVDTIKNKVDHSTTVTMVTVANNARLKFFNADINTLKNINVNDYNPGGLTALFDGIGEVIERFKDLPDANSENTSFLVMTITDGEENNSKNFDDDHIVRLLKDTQSTDRWSFAFQLPPGYGEKFAKNFGIPRDNIREWEATEQGMQEVQQSTSAALSNYFTARSAGVRSVQTFYVNTDLSKLSEDDIKKNLVNIAHNFKVLTVDKEMSVKEFVESKAKMSYVIGAAYYQLMKPEKIQQKKAVLIMEKGKRQVWGGDEARKLIGLPDDGIAKVFPGNHSNFDIFVQSTSVNRKLPRGTKVLVDITQTHDLTPTWDHTAVPAIT